MTPATPQRLCRKCASAAIVYSWQRKADNSLVIRMACMTCHAPAGYAALTADNIIRAGEAPPVIEDHQRKLF